MKIQPEGLYVNGSFLVYNKFKTERLPKMAIKQYVEFMYPGAFFSETEVREVKERDPTKLEVPQGCFGYRFFERQEVQEGGETLFGQPRNYSGTTYFGKAMTIADVKREMPDAKTLISNMENNGWDKVVKTRRGNFQPLQLEDRVI